MLLGSLDVVDAVTHHKDPGGVDAISERPSRASSMMRCFSPLLLIIGRGGNDAEVRDEGECSSINVAGVVGFDVAMAGGAF